MTIPSDSISLLTSMYENKHIDEANIFARELEMLFPYNLKILKCISKYNPSNLNIVYKILSFPGLSHSHAQEYFVHLSKYVKIPTYSLKLNYSPNPNGIITLTMTTCKRIHLFKQTMDSFMCCCQDLSLIKEWIIVDDNSSLQDRNEMTSRYPFVKFIMKDENDKGHARSMNIILNKIKTPYIFHLEDDWTFYIKDYFLTKCLDIINDDDNIGQCLINQNYAELPTDYHIKGGIPRQTDYGTRYTIHEYCEKESEQMFFLKKYGQVVNCAYWKHYSLRPSLIRTSVLQKIGHYNENIQHFEMEYSERYIKYGYVSAFMEGISCKHTGRLTSERFDITKDNAYSLNDEGQFTKKEYGYQIHVINLDRRPDRMKTFEAITPVKFNRISAIDGLKLKSTFQLQRIFDGNDYNMKVGMVGCALTHIKLWIEILKSESDIHLILEDDITFVHDFKCKLHHVIKQLEGQNWDITYVGHHIYKKYVTDDTFNKEKKPCIKHIRRSESLEFSAGGTIGYLINKKGCKGMLDFINKHGMTNCIDTMQQKAGDELNLYYTTPHLVYSDYVQANNKKDTDIQSNTASLTIPLVSKIDASWLKLVTLEQVETYEGTGIAYYETLSMTNIIKLKYPYYTIENKVLVICPNGYEKRLKEYDISDCFN